MIEYGIWLLCGILLLVIVSFHYEVMMTVSDRLVPWLEKRLPHRRVIALSLAGLMLGHIVEIWLFSLALMLTAQFPSVGSIQGDFSGRWGDYLYLSTVNYTSLGDSSIRIAGHIRAVVASETLVGMMMIAWSASYTFLKMEQGWRARHPNS